MAKFPEVIALKCSDLVLEIAKCRESKLPLPFSVNPEAVSNSAFAIIFNMIYTGKGLRQKFKLQDKGVVNIGNVAYPARDADEWARLNRKIADSKFKMRMLEDNDNPKLTLAKYNGKVPTEDSLPIIKDGIQDVGDATKNNFYIVAEALHEVFENWFDERNTEAQALNKYLITSVVNGKTFEANTIQYMQENGLRSIFTVTDSSVKKAYNNNVAITKKNIYKFQSADLIATVKTIFSDKSPHAGKQVANPKVKLNFDFPKADGKKPEFLCTKLMDKSKRISDVKFETLMVTNADGQPELVCRENVWKACPYGATFDIVTQEVSIMIGKVNMISLKLGHCLRHELRAGMVNDDIEGLLSDDEGSSGFRKIVDKLKPDDSSAAGAGSKIETKDGIDDGIENVTYD